MSFHSYLFILVFLPLVCVLYFSANRCIGAKAGKTVLLLASLVFIVFANVYSAVALVFSIAINRLFGRLLGRNESGKRKPVLAIGVAFNVLYLSVFKYTNSLLEIVSGGGTAFSLLMPLGISFYTFQQIAYLVDCYRGDMPDSGFLDYAVGTAFFPKLIQGPITYHKDFIPQLCDGDRKAFNGERLARGLALFSRGLAKKVLVADTFGKIVDYGYAHISALSGFEALLTILAYTLQIYFDFSGYSDMAVGVADMLGFDLPWNFDSPYKALNISDFWKRWHITLTRFLTSYIYIPLGGNRKGTARTCMNILIVFLISGLWHGVGLTFVIWGLLHGIASVAYRLTKKIYDRIPKLIQWFMTFVFINITWVFFRAGSISDAFSIMGRVVHGGWAITINAELTETLLMPTLINIPSQFLRLPIVLIVFVVAAIAVCLFARNTREQTERFRPTVRSGIVSYILLTLSMLSLSGVGAFLYTNF